MPTVVVPPGYAYAQAITVTGGSAAVGGSTTTPKPTTSQDYVACLHLTGSAASTIYGQLQHPPGSAVDATATADIGVYWWNGSAWVQIAMDIDQQSYGLWSASNIALWFGLQANLAASPATDANYMLAWGNSAAQGQSWANLYPMADDFAGTALGASWGTQPSYVAVASSVMTLSQVTNGGLRSILHSATFGTGYEVAFRAAIPIPQPSFVANLGLTQDSTFNTFDALAANHGFDATHLALSNNLSGAAYNVVVASDAGDYHAFRLARNAGGVTYGAVDTPASGASISNATGTTTIALAPMIESYDSGSGANNTIPVDWVKVRPWIATEPAAALTGTAVAGGSAATALTLGGPASGQAGQASSAFTVGLNGYISANETVALSDGGAGGTFTPSSLTFVPNGTSTPASQTFTYTPAAAGTDTLTATGSGAFANTQTATYTATAAAPAAPGAPTAAVEVGLSWGAVSGAASYNVYRGGVKVGSPTGTTYTDATVAEGQSYTYTVTAVNGSGVEGAASSGTTVSLTGGGLRRVGLTGGITG